MSRECQRIPSIFHFVFLGFTDFTFIHYISLLTCKVVHQPDILYLYVHHIPEDGKGSIWWYEAQELVTLEKVALPNRIFGQPVTKFQHMADIIRLEKLIERGGVYLDLDVVSIRPFPHLYNESCVLGKQCPNTRFEGLCNAVIMAEPKSFFLQKWYQEYRSFRKTRWDHHSVKVPLMLSRLYGQHLRVMDSYAFFPVTWEEPQFMTNRSLDRRLSQSFLVHLWESEWEKTVLKEQGPQLLQCTSTFSRYVNQVLGLPDWASIQKSQEVHKPQQKRISHSILKSLPKKRRHETIFPPRPSHKKLSHPPSPKPMNPKPGVPYIEPINIPPTKPRQTYPLITPLHISFQNVQSNVSPPKPKPPIVTKKTLQQQVQQYELPFPSKSHERFQKTVQLVNHQHLWSNGRRNNIPNQVAKFNFETSQALRWMIRQHYSSVEGLTHHNLSISKGVTSHCMVVDLITLKALIKYRLFQKLSELPTHFIGIPHLMSVSTPNGKNHQFPLYVGVRLPKGDLLVPVASQGKTIKISLKRIERENRICRVEHVLPLHSPKSFEGYNQNCSSAEAFGILQASFPRFKFIWASPFSCDWEIPRIQNLLQDHSSLPKVVYLAYPKKTKEGLVISSISLPPSLKLFPIDITQLPEILKVNGRMITSHVVYPLRIIPETSLPILLPARILDWYNIIS